MTVQECMNQINYSYRGSDDDAPVAGSVDYAMWLAAMNRKLSEYARDTKVSRASLFEVRSVGTISATSQSYDLDDDFLDPSDVVIVTTPDGRDVEYTVDKPQERGRSFRSVYISGRDPKQMTFYDTFTSTSEVIGGTLKVGGYYLPADLTRANDTIPVDDPYWLVAAVAGTLAFNDLTYESKYPDLQGQANVLYKQMAANNRRGTAGNPRTAQTRVARIVGTRGRR